MKKLIFTLLVFACAKVSGQTDIPVDLYRGMPQITVPLWTVSSHELSDQIGIVYDAKGLRVDEPNGKAGLGWSLQGGGSITREVRGLPDDFTGQSGDARRGWLYQTSASVGVNVTAGNLPNTADNLATTCDETADHNAISTNNNYTVYDTEPDIFTFSAGDLYGKFVFDNQATPQVRLIPYQDVKITVDFVSSTDKTIKDIVITNNKGVKYYFGAYSTSTAVNQEAYYTTKLTAESTVEYLTTKYYNYNKVTYPTAASYGKDWMLLRVVAPAGDYLGYTYSTEAYDYYDTVRIAVPAFATGAMTTDDVYYGRRTGSRCNLTTVSSALGSGVTINYSGANLITSIVATDVRRPVGSESFRTFAFTYATFQGYTRESLMSVQESFNGTKKPAYQFGYNMQGIGSPYTKAQDFWGYYNAKANALRVPKVYVYPDQTIDERYRLYPIPGYTGTEVVIDGADRTPDPVAIKRGSLTSITYPWNAKTTLDLEANMFFDPVTNMNHYGQGLRVKTITYEDLFNPDTKIVKSYTYTEAGGNSSGRILHHPAFAVPTWEYRDPTSAQEESMAMVMGTPTTTWTWLTARLNHDLYGADAYGEESVGYKTVTVATSGIGHIQYDFTMPATYKNPATGVAAPTNDIFARPSTCPSMEIVALSGTTVSGPGSFPYAPDPNFDYERGLLLKKQEFNESNVLLRKTENVYQNQFDIGLSGIYTVKGYHYEKYPNSDANIFFFGKYNVLTGTKNVLTSETVTTYDALNAAKFTVETKAYTYGSGAHRLLTKVVNTKSDGVVYSDYFRYPLDYSITVTHDVASAALVQLQTDFRNNTTIEHYSTVNRGSGEVVYDGALTTFGSFAGITLPQFVYAWNSETTASPTGFASSYNSGAGTFVFNNAYEITKTYVDYDLNGRVKTFSDQSNKPTSILWTDRTSAAFATVHNANLNQVAFSDFDHANALTFTIANNSDGYPSIQYGTGRTGLKSVYPEIKLSKQLNKGADKYLLTGWFNKTTTPLNITYSIKASATDPNPPTTRTVTIPKSNSTSAWQYFEVLISIPSALTDFYIEIMPDAAPNSYLDDIALYPATATLSNSQFSFPYGEASISTGSKTKFIDYDNLGRIKFIRDKDRNILERRTYNYTTPAGAIYPQPPM